jgi:molybdopterin-guanine dinucleotide biosynthesis protein A
MAGTEIDVEGFILAGGTSSRFGRDKALARAGSRTLLERARGALGGLGLTPRIVCRDATAYAGEGFAFVVAERPDLGPVEGLRAALAACAAPWALVLAVDMPEVDARLLRILLAARGEVAAGAPRAVCFAAEGRRHPLPGVYHASVRDEIERRAPRSLQDLLDGLPARVLDEPAAGVVDLARRLRNVNRVEDLGVGN